MRRGGAPLRTRRSRRDERCVARVCAAWARARHPAAGAPLSLSPPLSAAFRLFRQLALRWLALEPMVVTVAAAWRKSEWYSGGGEGMLTVSETCLAALDHEARQTRIHLSRDRVDISVHRNMDGVGLVLG